ncbi:molybdopterin molybdotransferase MoeA [Jiulongibacter sediminis]|jgi:molybdopterin molybdotransferase|uniref:molybdopterin molybdotransferase MoeA n=1 Tax=Jiulongibacter sediminis TaxID=1605367 RepID=UPI0026F0B9A0|nr:molybdopterin molybdotransferase MoeA [Jiulongibacter sediminis]
MDFITVQKATELILKETRDFGEEKIAFLQSAGRVLAEDICADRDFPPFDRVTMDGFAFRAKDYVSGCRTFNILGTQYAGEAAVRLNQKETAVEVMTGTPLPGGADSVIRVEDTTVLDGKLILPDGQEVKKNIHYRGIDRKKGDVILKKGHLLKTPDMAVLATVGKTEVLVKSRPKVAVITSGDELVEVHEMPEPHQIRKSNVYAISEHISNLCETTDHFHITDDLEETTSKLQELLTNYDVLILSGGVSAGKKDYMPTAMEKVGVEKVFHKIQQRPGKPMWFGKKGEKVVFALPGNPVSAFMCAVRYVKPWLEACFGLQPKAEHAQLGVEVTFVPKLSYFMQVQLVNDKGVLKALPNEGHGSGDLANLSDADAFLEMDLREGSLYNEGDAFQVWRY